MQIKLVGWILLNMCLIIFNEGFSQHNTKQLEIAEAYVLRGNYNSAIVFYKRYANKHNSVSLQEKIANCYVNLREYEKAIKIYEALLKKGNNTHLYLSYGKLLLLNNSVFNAKKYFKMYQQSFPKDSLEVQIYLASCDSILNWMKEDNEFRVFNIRKLNTEFSEISPTFYGDKLVFSSDQQGVFIKKRQEGKLAAYYNLFISEKKSEKWSTPHSFSEHINTPYHEAAACFDSSLTKIYFTHSKFDSGKMEYESEENKLKLYSSKFKGKIMTWSIPERFNLNTVDASFAYPFISKDGQFFFFCSDMEGGYGGMDIYVCINIDGVWSSPLNAGPVINSLKNELYPFLSEDGTLYFSSNGHVGFGGYDIFQSKSKNGEWQHIENMKSPINSTADDFSFIWDEINQQGYFSSNRKGGEGKEDLYMVKK